MLRAGSTLAVAAALLAAPSAAAAAAGDPDLTIGPGGEAVVPAIALGGQTPVTAAPILQPDGKYLVSGRLNDQFFIARLNANLELDTTFSGDGMAVADFIDGGEDAGEGLAVQPDGKIVQAGNAGRSIGVARWLPDGSPDASFDGDGKALIDFGDAANADGKDVAVQADGRIVAVGDVAGRVAIGRLNANGSLDTGFSGDGKDRLTDFTGGSRVVLQPDGKILVVGSTQFSAARYRTDGVLDTGFGGDGVVQTPVEASAGAVNRSCGVAVQPDGRIVLVGSSGPDFALARFDAAGNLDPAFSGDGRVTSDLGGNEIASCNLALQPDGKIVMAGASDGDFAIARYTAGGSLDPAFGGDGSVTTDFDETEFCCTLVVRPKDGRVVATGRSVNLGTSAARGVVARYHAIACGGKNATRVGTSGPETLVGALKGFGVNALPLTDVIEGFGGNDTIDGGGADDALCGGLGADTISGGSGADHIDVRDGVTDGPTTCGPGSDIVFADLTDPFETFAASCESIRRFALDDGPPGFPARRRLAIRAGGRAVVRVSCPRRARVRCRGRLTLSDPRRPARTLARARYRVRLGRTRAVTMRLSPRAATRLRARGRVRARTLERGVSKKGRRSAVQLLRVRG